MAFSIKLRPDQKAALHGCNPESNDPRLETNLALNRYALSPFREMTKSPRNAYDICAETNEHSPGSELRGLPLINT